MLLFKKKKKPVCNVPVTRFVLSMIYVRKWFFKKLSWRYIPVRCFCENAAFVRAVNASCNSVIWEAVFTCYIPLRSQNKPAGPTVAFLYFISLGPG